MHNTERKNLEFKITSTEGNVRWLLGEEPRNEGLIAKHIQTIADDKKKLEKLNELDNDNN